MFVYLGLALLLLVVMAWFVLAPFLAPSGAPAVRSSSRPPVVLPPRTTPRAPVATAPTRPATAPASPATRPARSDEELRASVEAAIAARKAAMVRHSCGGCGAPVDAGDAFCRACGTRVEEA